MQEGPEEKEFFTGEEKRKFWEANLLGTSAVKSLLYEAAELPQDLTNR